MKRASAFLRTIAFFIDLLVLGASCLLLQLSGLLGYAIGARSLHTGDTGLPPGLLYVFISLFYFTYLTARGGQTIGKRSMGIRVTKIDGEKVGVFRSLWRSCCYPLSTFPFLLGFFVAFIIRGRSLHDFLAGTVVIEE